MELGAQGVVVNFDPPNTLSWINLPAGSQFRRIQWWFNFMPAGQGTGVKHEVEVDFGELTDPTLIGLRDNWETIRVGFIREGMRKTLNNLGQGYPIRTKLAHVATPVAEEVGVTP